MRGVKDDFINVESEYKKQKYRKNDTFYNEGFFEWTYFKTKADGLYLLLVVNQLLNDILLGADQVVFESELIEAIDG